MRFYITAALLLLPSLAMAQAGPSTPVVRLDTSSYSMPAVAIYCPSSLTGGPSGGASGSPVAPCVFGGGGGGGGGTVTQGPAGAAPWLIKDAALEALISGGALATSVSNFPSSFSVSNFPAAFNIGNFPATQPVSIASSVPVTGTFFQATQPVSFISQPLPTGASTAALQPALNGDGGALAHIMNFPVTQPVSLASTTISNFPVTQPVTIPATTGPVTPGAVAANSMLVGCAYNSPGITLANGQQAGAACDNTGRLSVSINGGTSLQSAASGGDVIYNAINTTASAMAAQIKSNNGMVYSYSVCNNTTAVAFFRLFNQNGGAPTPGTSVPVVREIVRAGDCSRFFSDVGLVFAAGIGVDVTTGSIADSDATAIATANTVAVNVYYK